MHAAPVPRCLHSALKRTVEEWARQHMPRDADGTIKIDMSYVVTKVAELLAHTVHRAPDEPTKMQFERYARECLEGAFHHERTGEQVRVNTGQRPAAN